jgi:hypothetical protein
VPSGSYLQVDTGRRSAKSAQPTRSRRCGFFWTGRSAERQLISGTGCVRFTGITCIGPYVTAQFSVSPQTGTILLLEQEAPGLKFLTAGTGPRCTIIRADAVPGQLVYVPPQYGHVSARLASSRQLPDRAKEDRRRSLLTGLALGGGITGIPLTVLGYLVGANSEGGKSPFLEGAIPVWSVILIAYLGFCVAALARRRHDRD